MSGGRKKGNGVFWLNIIIQTVIGVLLITFLMLFINAVQKGFIYDNKKLILILAPILCGAVSIAALVFFLFNKKFFYKLLLLTEGYALLTAASLYLLNLAGLGDKFESIDKLRGFIASTGNNTKLIYVLIAYLQVVILPIPSIMAIGAGVAMFGPVYAVLLSYIGIYLGSLTAFFLGRIFGVRLVNWLLGKETVQKYLKLIKGKDTIVLTFMFLFPFFPDDALCFIAGISSMSGGYFVIMILIVRLITISFSAFSLNGNLIPYNTWWGISVWGIIFAVTVTCFIFMYKNGKKFEKWFGKLFKKKTRQAKGNK